MTHTIRLLTVVTLGFAVLFVGWPAAAQQSEVVIGFKKKGIAGGKPKAVQAGKSVDECKKVSSGGCKTFEKSGVILEQYTIGVTNVKLSNPGACVYTYTIGGVTYEYLYTC